MSFTSHKLNEEGFKNLENLKGKLVETRDFLTYHLGQSRELSIALTKLEECSFWSTKAMAQEPKNHSEMTVYSHIEADT